MGSEEYQHLMDIARAQQEFNLLVHGAIWTLIGYNTFLGIMVAFLMWKQK